MPTKSFAPEAAAAAKRPVSQGNAMRTCVILTAIATLFVSARVEAGHFCQHCGCQRNCRKVCRLVCETKKESKTEYSSECEDFCIPGPSKKCGVHFHCDCNGHHRKIIWQPNCAKVHTRKTLVKEQVSKEVPNYKWVVDEYCCVCGQWIKVDKDAEDGDAKDAKSKAAGTNNYAIAADEEPVRRAARVSVPVVSFFGASRAMDESELARPRSDLEVAEPKTLPTPAVLLGQRKPALDASAESYYAYYLGAEPKHSKDEAHRGLVSRLAEEEAGAAEVELDDSEREPRRLFLGLFGR